MTGVRVQAQFAAEPRSVGAARRLVTAALRAWQLEHLDTTATLLVSELATNAVLHARTSFIVAVDRHDSVVRVGVTDGARSGPAPRRHGPEAGTGRGLVLVAALATDWGTTMAEHPWAKTVWFEVSTDPAGLPGPRTAPC